jgi:hypothetical protein
VVVSGPHGYTDTDCTPGFEGGSDSAAAIVTGIVSLMLEANTNLTWFQGQEDHSSQLQSYFLKTDLIDRYSELHTHIHGVT